MKNYWLVKSEPEEYGYDHLKQDGTGRWDGVRNYQARNFMKEMNKGDEVLFYHSGRRREIVGLAEVVKEAYADPGAEDEGKGWVAVDLKAAGRLEACVSLDTIKGDPAFEEFLLVKQPRLSVMPVEKALFEKIIAMSKG
ncbi:EVE domain-containing protein [Roseivirga sp. BDSF3-8]|uniref:EVE domain-containing protein n=1 Tax=Roseivirga sp. BDSF3-8 TaxID=3241598 RepID=UPI003531FBD9